MSILIYTFKNLKFVQMLNYDSISLTEATGIQNELRHKVLLESNNLDIKTIAGGDISHNKFSDTVFAGIVILNYPELTLKSYSLIQTQTKFPYIPGYLGFREVPALLEAWKQLPEKPDLIVLDGQGVTHPRRMGIASHFGVLTDFPAIGCAKNMLFGKYNPLGLEKYSTSAIYDKQEILGYALRTKTGVKPVYVSPGHKISVGDSIEIMKNCCIKHRIPEPTRLAHDKVNLFRVGKLKQGYHVEITTPDLFS